MLALGAVGTDWQLYRLCVVLGHISGAERQVCGWSQGSRGPGHSSKVERNTSSAIANDQGSFLGKDHNIDQESSNYISLWITLSWKYQKVADPQKKKLQEKVQSLVECLPTPKKAEPNFAMKFKLA